MAVSYPTKVLLASRSGDRCSFGSCSEPLTADGGAAPAAIVGEAAHIAGEKPGAARYDASMTNEQRDAYPNLIYLCPTHHTKIDKQAADYPVHVLLKMKDDHERKVREAVAEALAEVRFEELEAATKWLVSETPAATSYDFTLTAPEKKLQRNGLGQPSRYLLVTGLGRSREVQRYIEMRAQTDANFPERLKAGFLVEYYKLVGDGVEGDARFELMCRFAQRGLDNQAQKAAGIALLSYLFEACDVFEK